MRHDFTEAERRLAKVAYEAYHEGRHPRPWESLHGHEQFRWLLVGWIANERRGQCTAETYRAVYHILTDQPRWGELRTEYRQRWQHVSLAITRALNAHRATCTMVISG
jgi:hypothetical protein